MNRLCLLSMLLTGILARGSEFMAFVDADNEYITPGQTMVSRVLFFDFQRMDITSVMNTRGVAAVTPRKSAGTFLVVDEQRADDTVEKTTIREVDASVRRERTEMDIDWIMPRTISPYGFQHEFDVLGEDGKGVVWILAETLVHPKGVASQAILAIDWDAKRILSTYKIEEMYYNMSRFIPLKSGVIVVQSYPTNELSAKAFFLGSDGKTTQANLGPPITESMRAVCATDEKLFVLTYHENLRCITFDEASPQGALKFSLDLTPRKKPDYYNSMTFLRDENRLLLTVPDDSGALSRFVWIDAESGKVVKEFKPPRGTLAVVPNAGTYYVLDGERARVAVYNGEMKFQSESQSLFKIRAASLLIRK